MKVLVVDDHALIRDALRSVLEELQPGTVVLEASDCAEADALAASHSDLHLVLMDLGLPDGEGLSLLRRMRQHQPSAAVVVLSATKDRATVTKSFELGAQGFIPKSADRAVMLHALRLVFDGGFYVPPEALVLPVAGHQGAPAATADSGVLAGLGLTERQIDVLGLLMRGKSNKAICRELNVAEATVKNHITAVLKALKVSNRTEAVLAVTALGWTPPTIQK